MLETPTYRSLRLANLCMGILLMVIGIVLAQATDPPTDPRISLLFPYFIGVGIQTGLWLVVLIQGLRRKVGVVQRAMDLAPFVAGSWVIWQPPT